MPILSVVTTALLGLLVVVHPLSAADAPTEPSLVAALVVHSVPEPGALSVFAVALILLGLMTSVKSRQWAGRTMRAAARGARRHVAAAFTSARKMLKNGASEGT